MKCNHENADHLMPGDVLTPSNYAPIEEGHPVLVEQFRCIDCGAWLSLGPSDEHASEAVEIEIRAAELAALHTAGRRIPHDGIRGRGTYTGCAGCGWNAGQRSIGFLDGKRNTLAGYLARCITTHEGGRDDA